MKSSVRMTEVKEVLMDTKREAISKKPHIDNIKLIKETMAMKISKNKKKIQLKKINRVKSTVMENPKRKLRNKHVMLMNQSHKLRMVRKEKRNESIFHNKFQPNFCMYIHLSQ